MNRSLVETIKERVSLVDILSRYMKLTTSGTQMKGLCPFHGEKTPSFYVSPIRGSWKCFGCGKGGDLISFVQEIEHISFREAVQNLAEQAGIAIEDINLRIDSSDETTQLYSAMKYAGEHYTSALTKDQQALAYLKKRGVTKESIVKFSIGFALDLWSNLTIELQKKYTNEICITSGLAIAGTKGPYDRFRSRIMFPTKDIRDRIVTFSGRIWSKDGKYITERDTSGKYINGPETAIYKKSKTLYGMSEARVAIAQKKRAIVVEGHLDCIMSHQVGFFETVALAGTALTDEHVDLLKRFCDHVVLCLDADLAGQKAVGKSLIVLYSAGFRVLVANLAKDSDPADVIQSSPETYSEAIENATEYVIARISQMKANQTSLVEGEKILKNEIYPIIAYQTNPLYRDENIRQLANYMNTPADTIREHMQTYLIALEKTKMDRSEKIEKREPVTISTTDRLLSIWQKVEQDKIPNSILEYLKLALQKEYLSYGDFFKKYAKEDQDYLLLYNSQYGDSLPTEALAGQIFLYCKECLESWEKTILLNTSNLVQDKINERIKQINSCRNYIQSYPYVYKKN